MNLRQYTLIWTFFDNHFYHNINEWKCKQILVTEFKLLGWNFFSHKKIASISLFSLNDCARILEPVFFLYFENKCFTEHLLAISCKSSIIHLWPVKCIQNGYKLQNHTKVVATFSRHGKQYLIFHGRIILGL